MRGHGKCAGKEKVICNPGQAPMDRLFKKLSKQHKEMMDWLFRTSYCLAKNGMSLWSFSVLCQLQSLHGLSMGTAYMNEHSASPMITSIAAVQTQYVIDEIEKQEFFSLLIDGSTD